MTGRSSSTVTVDRCICREVSFLELREIAVRLGCRSVAQLQQYREVSDRCQLCLPYVQATIETGRTVHPLLEPDDAAALVDRSGVTLKQEGSSK